MTDLNIAADIAADIAANLAAAQARRLQTILVTPDIWDGLQDAPTRVVIDGHTPDGYTLLAHRTRPHVVPALDAGLYRCIYDGRFMVLVIRSRPQAGVQPRAELMRPIFRVRAKGQIV